MPLATKPSAVEVTDQFSSSFGSPSVVFNSTDDQQYRVSGMSQISDNEIWFYNSSTGNTTNRFTKLNLSDKTLTRIGRGYVVNDVINHKGKLYCTNFGSTGSGWSWNNSPGEIDRNAGTIVALNPYSNAERGRDGGVSFGDYIWFISRTPNTVDGHKQYMYRYNPESSAAIAYTNTGAEFIYTSQLRAYNKKYILQDALLEVQVRIHTIYMSLILKSLHLQRFWTISSRLRYQITHLLQVLFW